MYVSSILWYLSWPAFIALSYIVIRAVIRFADQRNVPEEE